ncbi:MAG: InlB B-repeat-containing protein, partial [Ignavibacteriales bacterium]|nr:InlB B-repeat-containing protein [Ignavibacteriales bacterium]
MKTYLQFFIIVLVAVLLIGTTATSQTTGDWRSLVTPGSWIVANNWEQFDGTNWVTSTTIPGATAATDSTRSVTIRSGHTMTMTNATKHMKNLIVESGAVLNSNVVLPTTAYPRYYGNVTVDGTYGSPTDGMGVGFYEAISLANPTPTPTTHTISGSGTIYMSRIQPQVNGQTIIFDANLTATYAGSTGTGSTSIYNNGKDNITFTLNSGKTLTLANNSYIAAGTSGSTGTALNLTLNIYGTLTTGSTNAQINLAALTAKTQALYVFNGGIVNLGSNIRCDATTGATTIIDVAQGGTINCTGTAQFNCGPATTTVNGTIDFGTFSTSTRNIGTATVGSTGKLLFKDGAWPTGAITLSSGSTVEYYGTSALTLGTSPTSYQNLIMNNSAGLTLGTNATVNGTLTLNGGNISTGAYALSLSSTGSISRTSGFINGTFQKYIGTGTGVTKTFEIGSGSDYTPVDVTFANVTTAGDLSAKSTGSDHANLLYSQIDPAKSLNRYYTLTNNVTTPVGFDNYNAVFNFVSGDVDGSANTNNFLAQKYNGSAWSGLTVGNKTGTSTEVTGATSFSDFAFGEEAQYTLTTNATNGSVAKSPDQATYTSGTNVTVTATPNTGYNFVNWSGDLTSSNNPETIAMYGNKSVTANFVLKTYILTYTAGANGSISGTTPQTVNHGSDGSAVTAVPNTGYHFVDWSDASTANPRTDLAVTADISVTANFAINQYTLSTTAVNGSITKSPDQLTYDYNTSVQLTAVPDGGYTFTGWSGDLTGSTNPESLVMDGDKSITANFSTTVYTLTVNATNGTVTKSPDQANYSPSTVVTLTAVPNTGYNFVDWTGDLTGSTNPNTITMDANKNVTANFAINTYTLTVNSTNGSVTKTPDQLTYDHGTTVNLSATANSGYHFVNWSGDLTGSTNPVDITMDANKTITANFAIDQYTLSITATNGSVTLNPTGGSYDPSTVVTLTPVPNTGYHFVDWSGDLSGSTNPNTITMDANKNVTANFAINTYSLTVNASNGSVTKTPDQTSYDHGTTVNLSASANSGYQFVNWSGDLTGSTNPVDISMDANKTITANFAIIQYTLSVTAINGSVTLNPTGGTYDINTVVTLTPVPNTGYHFVDWSGDLSGSANPTTITMDANKNVTANFAINTYTLTINATNGSVTLNPSGGTYNHGTTVQLTPAPDPGYQFSSWSGDLTGTANPGSIVMTTNKTVTANFILIPVGPTPLAGDYGTAASGNWGVAGTWVICATNGTWVGATAAGAAPTSAVNAWVRGGHKLNVESSGKTIKNLFIENNGIIVCANVNPTSSQVYVRIYGDSVYNGGSVGFDPATPTVYTALGFENYTSSKTVKFTGPGTYKVSRIRQGSSAVNTVAMIDRDMLLTYAGSGGTGGMAWYSQGDNAGLTINAGKTLTVVDYGYIGAASSASADGNSISILVNGTLSMSGPNSQVSLMAAAGKTISLTVNGLVDIGRSLSVTGTTGVTSTLTVNSGGELRAGSAGTGGLIDFSNALQTITGAGTFTLGAGTNLLVGAPAGMDPISGPIRTAVRNFPTGAGYRFVGTSAQVTGPEFPTNVRRLTIGNPAGVTLGNSVNVDTSFTLTAGTLITGSNMLTLPSWATVTRTSGHVVGTLKEGVAVGTAVIKNFPIGNATKYSPVDITFANVTTGGDLTVTTTSTVHPQVASSKMDPAKSLNRYYSVANNGVVFDTYDANFGYDATDYASGVNPLAFIAQKYDGGIWNNLNLGTKTSTSTQITGSNSFSDFAIGEPISYVITSAAFGTGTISPSGAVSVYEGSDQQFMLTAGLGSSLDSLVVDGVLSDSTTSYTFKNVTAPHTITAYFKTVTKTIVATAHGDGTILPSGSVEVTQGTDQAFTMTPYPGGSVTDVLVDGVSQGAITSYTFTNVQVPHTIDAYFSTVSYTLGTTVVGSGSVTKVPDQTSYSYGTSVQLTATSDPGNHFVGWSGDATGGTNPLTITMDGNKNITATFAANPHLVHTKGVDGNWSDPAIWEFGVVPTSLDSVVILAGDTVTYDPANSTIANLEIAGGFFSIKTGNSALVINGSILVDPNAVFKTQTSTTGGDLVHTITVQGDITNNGGKVFDWRRGTSGTTLGVFNLVLTGSGNSTLTNNAVYSDSVGDFNAVTINKQGTGRVILGSNIIMSNGSTSSIPAAQSNLVFVRGKVQTGSYAFVQMGTNSGQVSGMSDSGYVIGTMGRGMSSSTAQVNREFPIGDENGYRPVTVRSATAAGASGHYVTVTAISGDANTGSSTLTGGIDKVSKLRYYKVKYFKGEGSALSTMNLDKMRLSYGSDDGVRGGNTNLRVAYSTDARATWNGLTQLRYPHTTSLTSLPRTIQPDSINPAYTMTTGVTELYGALANEAGGVNTLDGTLGAFAVAPTSLTFGTVMKPATETQSVVVSNTGTSSLTILTATTDSVNEYSVLPSGPVTIPVAGNQTFNVTFHPSSKGTKTGNAIFSHDGLSSPGKVALTGEGNAVDTFIVSGMASPGGTVTPTGPQKVPEHGNVSFTFAADACYHLDSVLVDGVNIGAVPSYTFTDVMAPHAIVGFFSKDKFNITTSAGSNGSITPSGVVSVDCGTDKKFTITPDVNYRIDKVYADAIQTDSTISYTFKNVTADHTISATFALNAYILTMNVEGNGTVTRDPEVANYEHGTHVELTAIPDHGWIFSAWSGDATGSVNPLDVVMDGAKSITATFILDPVYQTQYRSFDPDSIAKSVDLKLKYKYIARKANACEFEFDLTAPQSVALTLKFSMLSSGVVMNGTEEVGSW